MSRSRARCRLGLGVSARPRGQRRVRMRGAGDGGIGVVGNGEAEPAVRQHVAVKRIGQSLVEGVVANVVGEDQPVEIVVGVNSGLARALRTTRPPQTPAVTFCPHAASLNPRDTRNFTQRCHQVLSDQLVFETLWRSQQSIELEDLCTTNAILLGSEPHPHVLFPLLEPAVTRLDTHSANGVSPIRLTI